MASSKHTPTISSTRSKLEDFPTAEFDALFGLDPTLNGGRGNRPSGRVLPLILRNKRRRLLEGQEAAGAEGGAAETAGEGAEAQGGPEEQASAAAIPTVSDDDSTTAAAASNGAADLLSSIIDAQSFATTTSTTTSFTTPQWTTLLHRTHATLTDLQRQLHRGEELYHADTDARGNLYKGWDAILDARGEDVGADDFGDREDHNFGGGGGGGYGGIGGGSGTGPARRMPVDNRWFSGSCPTFAVGGTGRGGRQGKKNMGGGTRPSLLVAGVASPARASVAGIHTPASSRSAAANASAATPASTARGPPILPTPQGPKVNVNVTVKGQLTTPAHAQGGDAVNNPIAGAASTATKKAAGAGAAATAVTTRPVGPAAVPEGLVPGGAAAGSTPSPLTEGKAAVDAQDVEMEDAVESAAPEEAEAATPAPAPAPAPATGGRASSRKSTRKRTRG